MTVIAIDDHRRPSHAGAWRSHPRSVATEVPELTLTLEVTFTGVDAAIIRETLARNETIAVRGRLRPGTPQPAPDGTHALADLVGPLRLLGVPEPETVRIDVAERSVRVGQVDLTLSRLEFELLLFLAEHPRQVFTREQLLVRIWGDSFSGVRTVDVHVSRLRNKLGAHPVISTLRGIGYRLADNARVTVRR